MTETQRASELLKLTVTKMVRRNSAKRSSFSTSLLNHVTSTFSSSPHEDTTAIFRLTDLYSSPAVHTFTTRFSLAKPKSQQANEPITLPLPSPAFTPASLHFTLGFLYTGTLILSNRNYDLNTAFAILRSATYLSLDTLYNEIQARIIQEMIHGLFHTFLSFAEYERLTSSKWGTGGCRCGQCARRAPRVLELALADDSGTLTWNVVRVAHWLVYSGKDGAHPNSPPEQDIEWP